MVSNNTIEENDDGYFEPHIPRKKNKSMSNTSHEEKNGQLPDEKPEGSNSFMPDDGNVGAEPEYTPFNKPVVERPYTKPQVDASEIPPVIDEPVIVQRKIEAEDTTNTSTSNTGGSGSSGGNGNPPNNNNASTSQPVPSSGSINNVTNQAFNELDSAEKTKLVKQTVSFLWDAYQWIHDIGGSLAQIDMDKVNAMIDKGEIKRSQKLQVSETVQVGVHEFIGRYNSNVKEILTVSDEFKEKMTPALERVALKRGWALTDEQYLIFGFGKDISVKAGMIWGVRKSVNFVLDHLKEQNKQQKNNTDNAPSSDNSYRDSNTDDYAEEEPAQQHNTPPPPPHQPPPPQSNNQSFKGSPDEVTPQVTGEFHNIEVVESISIEPESHVFYDNVPNDFTEPEERKPDAETKKSVPVKNNRGSTGKSGSRTPRKNAR